MKVCFCQKILPKVPARRIRHGEQADGGGPVILGRSRFTSSCSLLMSAFTDGESADRDRREIALNTLEALLSNYGRDATVEILHIMETELTLRG